MCAPAAPACEQLTVGGHAEGFHRNGKSAAPAVPQLHQRSRAGPDQGTRWTLVYSTCTPTPPHRLNSTRKGDHKSSQTNEPDQLRT